MKLNYHRWPCLVPRIPCSREHSVRADINNPHPLIGALLRFNLYEITYICEAGSWGWMSPSVTTRVFEVMASSSVSCVQELPRWQLAQERTTNIVLNFQVREKWLQDPFCCLLCCQEGTDGHHTSTAGGDQGSMGDNDFEAVLRCAVECSVLTQHVSVKIKIRTGSLLELWEKCF